MHDLLLSRSRVGLDAWDQPRASPSATQWNCRKDMRHQLSGPPSRIRTWGLPLRRGTLYPAELRAVKTELRIIPCMPPEGKSASLSRTYS